ncbi:MAG: hypothetical protein H0W69_10545 [Gemmatimonadaceae bacterium]|nr:hypothetical protein [Gemmatimonadaceae bacterium]
MAAALPASAQSPVRNAPTSYAAGPWERDAVIGIQNQSSAADYSSRAALAGGTASKGQPIALMAVGGAAIVLGALMDNDARGLLMVGGSVIGLYGLYLYLR